jgi:hypothetical protein
MQPSGKELTSWITYILAIYFQNELFYNVVLNKECVTAASTGGATAPPKPPCWNLKLTLSLA